MKKFWANKRVLITGHTGFKGSWLSLWLKKMGADVAGYSLECPFNPNLFELAEIKQEIKSYHGDIRDLNSLKKAFNEHKPDIVFHLAAQSLVRESYLNPIETFKTNVMGTVNVFEAVRETESVKVCVNVTSDKCYENREWERGYVETDAMGGYDPYSCSKGCAELVTSAYRRSFLQGKGIASARAGNVIGGGDWSKDRLIPDIINSIMEEKTLLIRNPNAIRPWQFVLEPLRGYLMLAQKLWENPKEYSQGWNFGPEDSDILPVSDIMKKTLNLWEKDIFYESDKNTNPHEACKLKLDCSLAKSKLGWKPLLNIDEALQYTVDWYKAYQNKMNTREYTFDQIDNYEKLIGENSCIQSAVVSAEQN